MKKVYLTILGITALTSSFAQRVTEAKQAAAKKIYAGVDNAKAKPSNTAKALGSVVWTDDFSNPSTWNIDNDGQSGANFGWKLGTTEQSWYFTSGINSTTKLNNYAQVNNGVYSSTPANNTQALNVTYTMTSAAPIDVQTLAGSDKAVLNFQQYGALFNDDQQVQISTDSVNFVTVYTNNNRTTFIGNNPTAIYANPENISVNISNFIAGDADSVYIRFAWTSRFSTQQTTVAWTTFGWFIDDVNLTTLPDNNLTLLEPLTFAGAQELIYSKIPVNQISPITFSGKILNNGSVDQNAVNLNVAVTGGSTYSGTSAAILSLDTAAYVTNTFTPTATVANYTYTFTATGLTDDVPSDNSATGSISITNSEYRVDNGIETGGISNVSSEPTGALKIGNLFEIIADDKIDSMYITLTDASTNIGQEFSGEIWFDNGTDFEYLNSTDFVTITAQNNGTTVKLPLQSISDVTAGTVLLVMASHSGGANSVEFAMAQDVQTGTVLGIPSSGDPADLFQLTNPAALMVGLSLNQDASLTENNNTISVSNMFPNPTSGSTAVNYTLANASKVSINVVDVAGKLVYSSTEGTQVAGKHTSTIDASSFNTGVYYVTITTNDSQVTKKLIKK
jgi:hypothetical protein